MSGFAAVLGDDDADFSLQPGSNLGTIFGAAEENADASFQYTPKEQPKAPSTGAAGAGSDQEKVQHAVAAHVYKYAATGYTSVGQLGVAVLGTASTKRYKVLAYDASKVPVAQATLHQNFGYTPAANNYASFYDDSQQSWSIRFNTDEAATEFAKNVAIGRFNTSGDDLVVQDMVEGTGSLKVAEGDSVEVRYTGWLHDMDAAGCLGRSFDSNVTREKAFRFKVGKGKVIRGWDKGLIGMKKGGKRCLCVPASLGYGAGGSGEQIPPNAALIFTLELTKHKSKDGKSSETAPVATSSPERPRADSTATAAGDAPVEEDPAAARKAALLERMSKMGQSMGVDGQGPQGQFNNGMQGQPGMMGMGMQGQPGMQQGMQGQPGMQGMMGVNPMGQPNMMMQQQGMMGQGQGQFGQNGMGQGQNPPMSQALAVPQQPTQQMLYDQFGNLVQVPGVQPPPQQQQQVLYDAFGNPVQVPQQQNPPSTQGGPPQPKEEPKEADVTTGVIGKKLDDANAKLDKLTEAADKQAQLLAYGPQMEAAVLMHNIQRVIQEGERMKKEIFEKSARIEQQNEKISDLLERNRKFVEDSNTMLEQRNDSFKATTAQAQARVLELEQEKSARVDELTAATNKLATLQMEFTALQRAESEVRAQLALARDEAARATEELASLQAAAGGSTAKMEELTRAHKEEKQLRKDAAQKLEALEEQLTEAQTALDSSTKKFDTLRKKAADDKARIEDELEELKTRHETEMEQMKRNLRKERQSGDADATHRIESMEAELTASWTDKLQRAVANNDSRWEMKYKNLEEDYNDLEARHATAQQTLQSTKSKDTERELMAQVEALQRTEADLRSQVVNLKAEVDTAAAGAASVARDASGAAPSLSSESIEVAYQRGLTDGAKKAKNGHSTEAVKTLMNGMYKSLRQKFAEGQSYGTADVMKEVLAVIKTSTLELLKSDEGKDSDDDDDSDGADDDSDGDDSDGDDSDGDDSDGDKGDSDGKDSDGDDSDAEDKPKAEPADAEDKAEDKAEDTAEDAAAPPADKGDSDSDKDDEAEGSEAKAKDPASTSSTESWVEVPEAAEDAKDGGKSDDDSWDEDDAAGPPAPTAAPAAAEPTKSSDDEDEDSDEEDKPKPPAAQPAAEAKDSLVDDDEDGLFGGDEDLFSGGAKAKAKDTKKTAAAAAALFDDDDEGGDDLDWLK
eukprot:m.34358 g.34358  ORF g.34358 m.34358 type:complete len:1191 (+) comp7311_c0_seq1:52-3624(+)